MLFIHSHIVSARGENALIGPISTINKLYHFMHPSHDLDRRDSFVSSRDKEELFFGPLAFLPLVDAPALLVIFRYFLANSHFSDENEVLDSEGHAQI